MNKCIYSMYEVDDYIEIDKECYDYLIIAPNIETRSREFCMKFQDKSLFRKIVLVDYENFHKNLNDEQEQNYYDGFIASDISYISIKCKDETEAIKGLINLGMNSETKVAFDITGFSIPNIYEILFVLKNVTKIRRLDVYYTEPKYYVYDRGYYDSYHIHTSQRTCAPIKGYFNSGNDEKEVLAIFLGFDGGLANLVYSKLAEESQDVLDVYLVNGFPSYTPKLKDISLLNNQDIITSLGMGKHIYHAPANNPFEVYNLLYAMSKQCGGNLLNICTIGSKPMALGACMFALENRAKVKVTYPFYNKVNFDEEEKPGKIWRYVVDFR